MNRFVRSDVYTRIRLASGGLFICLGATVVVRTLMSVGLVSAAVPAYVLGGAMVALGAVRIRYFLATRTRP